MIVLSRWVPETSVLGPGQRAAIWVQGCPMACPGCASPDTHSASGGEQVSVTDLASRLLGGPGVEGLTISGGEPFAQAQALTALIRELKRRTDWSFWVYSGYTLDHLLENGTEAQRQLVDEIDVLVDGPYASSMPTQKRWRGSSNQRVHLLSTRYRGLEATLEEEGVWLEARIDSTGALEYIGIPPPGFLDTVLGRLRERGIHTSETC